MLDFLRGLGLRGSSAAGRTPCFHCGLPVPPDCAEAVAFEGVTRLVCCAACASVMQSIIDCGGGHIYRQRAVAAESQATTPAAVAAEVRLGR